MIGVRKKMERGKGKRRRKGGEGRGIGNYTVFLSRLNC